MAARAKYCPVFESFWMALRNFSDAQRLRAFEAMCRYTFDGEVPDLSDDPMLATFWELARPNMDATIRRSETNRANAQRPRRRDEE